MLHAHSPLWNFFWIATNLLLLVVAYFIWKRGIARRVPAFLAFTIIGGLGELVIFGADIEVADTMGAYFWLITSAYQLLKTLLKFWVIAEVLSKLLVPYPSVSRLGRTLVSGLGAVLALLFGVVAGFGHVDRSIRLISGLEQTVFVIELGLIVLLFLFAAYFHLSWDRLSFGILLGLGVSACVRLATWAVINNATPREFPSEHTLTLFSFLNVATYHLCVLIWLSYVLVPQKVGTKSEVPWSENKLYFAVMLAVVLALVVGTVKLVGWKVPVDDGCSLGGTKGISTEPTVWQGSYGTAVTIRFATGTERLEGAQAVAIEPEEGYFLPVSGLTVPVMKLEPEL